MTFEIIGKIERIEVNEDQAFAGLRSMARNGKQSEFVLCVRNDDCDDLEPRKIYRTMPDSCAAREGYVRVVDDSGEDYLYPSAYFVPVRLPQRAKEAFAVHAGSR